MFLSLAELKRHVRIESDDLDFDTELVRFLKAAEIRVIKYINRNVYETLPETPLDNDIVIDASIEAAILDVAGYLFDNKGALDDDLIYSIMDSIVGHLRIIECD